MMVESFLEGGGEDLYFVPVSIAYDKILEEGAYLKESRGGKKGKESWKDLLKLPQFLKGRYGKVYIQFADPISLKTYLDNTSGELKEKIPALARQINIAINEVTPLMPDSILAAVLLSHPEKSITLSDIEQKTEALIHLAKQQKTRFSSELAINPRHAIRQTLEEFVKEDLLRSHFDFENHFFTISEEHRSRLDFYKNQGIHPFVKFAMEQCNPLVGAHRRAPLPILEDLLSREFFFSQNVGTHGGAPLPEWLSRLIFPTLESYWLTLYVLEYLRFDKMETKHLIQKIQGMGETLKQRGTLKFPESLSRFPLQNALAKYTEWGILKNYAAQMGVSGRDVLSLGENVEKRKEVLGLLEDILEKPKTNQWIREFRRGASL